MNPVDWPLEDVDVKAVVLDGAADFPWCSAEWAGGRAIDCFAVDREPLADLLEAIDFSRGDFAEGGRADVEEVVAAFAGDVDEIVEKVARAFEMGVVLFVAPGVVDGHAGFPVAAGDSCCGDALFRSAGVAGAVAETVVGDN